MKVFLAGIIQGSLVEADIHDQDWREPITQVLNKYLPEAEIYCHYSCHPNSITYELPEIKETLAEGIFRAGECDLLIAYAPSASMGTAIEMYEAARKSKTIVSITPMAANWVIRAYSDFVLSDIEEFEALAASGKLKKLVEKKTKK